MSQNELFFWAHFSNRQTNHQKRHLRNGSKNVSNKLESFFPFLSKQTNQFSLFDSVLPYFMHLWLLRESSIFHIFQFFFFDFAQEVSVSKQPPFAGRIKQKIRQKTTKKRISYGRFNRVSYSKQQTKQKYVRFWWFVWLVFEKCQK